MRSCSLRVEPSTIIFPYTYISSTTRFTIQIYNDTKRNLHFQWRKRDSGIEEENFIKTCDLDDPNQRQDIQKNLEFQSKYFSFEQKTGEIWPLRFQQQVVSFTPDLSILYQDDAYLYVVETGERFHVLLKGTGLAPEAMFSIQSLNIGHIFLESILEYEIFLENTGKANVEYCLAKHPTPGLIFEFSPEEGILYVNQKITIHIKFIANMVGSFNEAFTYKIKGAVQGSPTINIYGKVIGPTFSINTKLIDYGTVSYGFMYTKNIEIENKSEIPFDYTLSLSQDGSFSRREFSIKPSCSTIGKYSKQSVLIEFIPVSLQDYELDLNFDIAKYSEKLATIPIRAKCICPEIRIETTKFNLGNLFIGYSYKKAIDLFDDTDYPAKYEFIPVTDSTQLQARTEVPRPNGTINPHDKASLELLITPIQLGPLLLNQNIRIYGNDTQPINFTMAAICVGPDIKLSQNNIDFGQINVLQDIKNQISINNNSLIPAIFKARIEDEAGVFRCEPNEGTIPPNDTLMFAVIANLDDNITFHAKLILMFEHLNPIVVPLKGIGIGNTIRTSVDMSKIDMNYIFTERPIYFDFMVYNKGRRPMELRWTIQKPKIEWPISSNFIFKIQPESTTIPEYNEIPCRMTFQCNKPMSFTTGVQGYTTIRKKRTELFNPVIKGTFVRPELRFSQQTIEFHHLHDIALEEKETGDLHTEEPILPSKDLLPTITHQVNIKNAGKLALNMKFDCPKPFSISDTKFHLEPDEDHTFDVTFDPSFKTDFISELVTKKIAISFEGHPQINYITLKGFIEFPNVIFSPSMNIDFGNLMINTEQTKDITIDNQSELPVDLYWELFVNDKPYKAADNTSSIFDIYPTRAHIESKAKDVVRFSFFAVADPSGKSTKYKGKAICHIVGGPEYTLNISGGSAAIQYKIDPLSIDFGELSYKTRVHKTLTITNSSDVSISYAVKIPRGCSFQSFLVNPKEGTISHNQNVSIDLQILGGLPKVYNESFFVQIGHYDEVRIDVLLNCFIPQIQIGLPHHEDDPLMKAFDEFQLKKKAQKIRVETESDDEEAPTEYQPTEEELTDFERKLLINKMTDKSSTGFLNRLSRVQKSPNRGNANKGQAQEQRPSYDGPVSSKFILDMGTIVFGETKTKEFTIKSPTPYPITFDISTDSLEGTGFSIDPSSFSDLPQNEEITVTAKFNTKMRTNNLVGIVEFEIPIVLNDDVGYLIILKAVLEMPKLSFSKVHCDFGNVIVGQCYVVNIQLQNMNPVACEFKFHEAQSINVLQRSMMQTTPSVFEANPSSGILQPASFQNVEISFSPLSEKSYSMQFPITVKHNTQNSYITLRGYGVQLRVLFDPPELIMPPLNPFCEPTMMDVRLSNPTDYPIIVLSSQFDLKLLVDQAIEDQNIKRDESSQNDDSSAVQFTNATTAKFSICVIVSGAPGSGKTTVSQAISKFLDDAPILSLKEIWKDLLTNPEAPQADYVESFSNAISAPECANGFIIDGLDCLPEPPDLDSFLQKCTKTKNVENELQKNPLMVFPHQTMCGAEQALSYVLAALDGHYVFHVALKAPEAVLNARDEVIKAQEKRKKRIEQHQEKKMLFNMTEEQYNELTEEEQNEVDAKREKLRKKLLKKALGDEKDTTQTKSSSHRGHSSSKHHSSSSKSKEEGGESGKQKTSRRSKSERSESSASEKKEKSKREKTATDDGSEKKQKRSKGLPQDPIPYSVFQYQFTVGSIAQRLLDGGEYFQVIDPVDFLKETPPPTAHDNEEEETKNEAPAADEESSKKKESENNQAEEEQEKEEKEKESESEKKEESEKEKKQDDASANNNEANQADEEARINNRNSTPMPRHHHHHHKHRSKEKEREPSNVYHNMNTIIINTVGTVDEINKEVLNFLPSVKSLKEKAFTRFIPQPRLITKVPNLKKISLANVPQFFSIVVDDPITDITDLFPDSHSGHHSSSGRKSAAKKSRSHHHEKKNPHIPTIPDSIDLSTRTKRWEIEPKSDVMLTIVFNAKLTGEYHDVLTFNILNAKAETAKLRVCGICAYPDIERSIASIFPKVQRKYDPKISYTYANDVQEFHFGSVLVVKERSNKNQVPQYHQTIKLRNISLFPVEMVATLNDSQQKGVWWTEKNSLVIQPEETFDFQFGAHPVVPELYKTTLILTIKDQPDPLLFTLVCEGCAPTVDMDMKALDFEKILLNHQKTLKIELKNIGKLSLFWRIKGTSQLGPNFTFNQLEGALKPKQVFNILSSFTSNKPLVVKKGISLEILDLDKQRIFNTYQIPVSAESFDVNFDFLFPKNLDHLNYGSLKVSQTKVIQCILKNKGKYPSMFKVCISPLKIAKLFNVNPIEGVIQPGAANQQINFSFSSPRLVNFNNAKGVILQITDSLTNIITAEIPLSFSAQTLYSSFIIEPTKPINFGSTPVNVPVTKQFKITNNGAFPFEYEISGKPSPVVPVEAVSPDNKKKKPVQRASPAVKGRPRKGNEKSVTVGSFLFVPSVGTIQPRATATIDIDFNCSLPGLSQSTGLIKITDVDPKLYPNGSSIDVNGSTFVPGINTTDLERIFQGTHLCLRFDLSRITNQTVFLEDEQILHFAPLILQKKEIVPVTLINPQPIPISIDISIQPNTKSKASKVNFPFDISEKAVEIPPNETKTVDLSFQPLSQEKFQTIFEAVVKNGTLPDTKCFRFGIEAVGTLPSISYLPPSDAKGSKTQSSYTFNLGKTLVGFTKDKTIAIKNDGLIPARLAINAKASPDFALHNVETTAEFILEQEHILNLPVIFQPDKVRKSQFEIGISVLDNPKANLSFTFIGEGFSEDVTFEGLSDDDGNLIFKDNIVGRMLESSFIMRNVSQNDIRFSWPVHNDFNFIPRNGHLRLGKTKTIKVTFFSDKPQKTNGLKISCQWSKIELANPNAPDWDDNQKIIKFVTKGFLKQQEFQAQQQEALKAEKVVKAKKNPKSPSKKDTSQQLALQEPPPDPSDDEIVKITEIKPEPEYTAIQAKYKDLQLKIVAISDYIKYSIDTTEIEFSPTMMYQSRTVECKLTNTSQIRFEYQWIVTQFHCLRSDYANTNRPPFNVFPSSGFIEAGHSTVFKVKFAPEEVDDFTATLICDIPYLSQMKPPSIKVTGFSRRPLCHFNVDMSDYISGGRRHPDYTEELPDDVKVIEIFSPSVSTRSTKKFEIINPTASPYQVDWTVVYDTSNGAIFCDTPNAVVSSGKKHMASFTYLPTSVKTLEKLYEFHIPEHNIRIPFLVVGRIMPNT